MIGDSVTNSVMQRALDGVWQRQKAISANLSNFETPNYKARYVDFEQALISEVEKIASTSETRAEIRSKLGDISKSKISVETDNGISMRADGNNVDLDQQNIELVKAQIQYMYLTNSMTNAYSRLKTAIRGGNG